MVHKPGVLNFLGLDGQARDPRRTWQHLKAWWRPVFLLVRRELRDQTRDWRIVVPIIAFTLFFPFLMNFTASRMVAFVERYGAEIIAERFFPFLLMVVGFFPLSISMVIALESFAGERERNTIEPLLIAPIGDAQLYVGKLIAVLILPLVASFLGIGSYIGVLAWRLGWWPELPLLIVVLALTVSQALVMVSAAVLLSTQATSVRAANLLATLIIVPVALLIQSESMLMFWRQYDALWYYVAGLLVTTVLFVRVGLAHFNREALLGREVDVLSPRWIWRTFWRAFRGEQRGLRAWYRHQVWPEVRRLGLPALGVTLLLMTSMYLGYDLVQDALRTLPLKALTPQERSLSPETYMANLQGWLRVSVFGGSVLVPMAILLHNLRALLLATLLGLFSFSVGGLLVLMMPFGILGGAMAYFHQLGVLNPGEFLLGFVVPHGVAEVPGIVLFGASLLRLGALLATPVRDKSLGEFWLESLAGWAKVFLGVVLPLFILAAFLEVHLAPRIALWVLAR